MHTQEFKQKAKERSSMGAAERARSNRLALALRTRDDIARMLDLTQTDLLTQDKAGAKVVDARRLIARSISQVLGKDYHCIAIALDIPVDEARLLLSSAKDPKNSAMRAIWAYRLFRIEGMDTLEIGRKLRINEASADRYLSVGLDLQHSRITYPQAMFRLETGRETPDGSAQGSSPD